MSDYVLYVPTGHSSYKAMPHSLYCEIVEAGLIPTPMTWKQLWAENPTGETVYYNARWGNVFKAPATRREA